MVEPPSPFRCVKTQNRNNKKRPCRSQKDGGAFCFVMLCLYATGRRVGRCGAQLPRLFHIAQHLARSPILQIGRRAPGKRQQIFAVAHQAGRVREILLPVRFRSRFFSVRHTCSSYTENLFLFLFSINFNLGMSFFATLSGGVVPRRVKNVNLSEERITCPRSSSMM